MYITYANLFFGYMHASITWIRVAYSPIIFIIFYRTVVISLWLYHANLCVILSLLFQLYLPYPVPVRAPDFVWDSFLILHRYSLTIGL